MTQKTIGVHEALVCLYWLFLWKSYLENNSVRGLWENPGVLKQCAAKGEFVLVTNRNGPRSLSEPFNDELLRAGVHISIAVKLYEDGLVTLDKAAMLAKMPLESFMKQLALLGVVMVDQSADELDADLGTLDH